MNESHCIKADGSQRCRISEVLLFYRPSGVASSFSMPLSPLSMQPSTLVSLPPFSTSPLPFLLCPFPLSLSISVARGLLVLLLDSTPYFFLYPHFGLRTVGTRLFFSLPFLSRLYLFPSPPPPPPPPPLP